MIRSQSRSFACNGVPKRELGNQKEAKTYRRNRYMIRVKMMLMRIQVPNGK